MTGGRATAPRIALIVSDYHRVVTDGLRAGALAAIAEAGWPAAAVSVFPAPGAYEIAQIAQRLAESGEFAAVVCLGCLIRGETPHFDYIARATADGIMRAAQGSGVPVAFGVLTTNTVDEAVARAGEGAANKGREAAEAALAMIRLYEQLPTRRSPGAGR